MIVRGFLDGWRQARLRRAAVRYAEHGWDVVPGAVRCGDRFRCMTRCPTLSCHPDWICWEPTATRDPRWVAALWAFRPRAILLATCRAFDVLEVPAFLGAGWGRGALRGPVAVTGAGRWMFLVPPGTVLLPEGTSAEEGARYARKTLLRRNGDPQDVAQAVLFLCAGPAFITGQILRVDGGQSLR